MTHFTRRPCLEAAVWSRTTFHIAAFESSAHCSLDFIWSVLCWITHTTILAHSIKSKVHVLIEREVLWYTLRWPFSLLAYSSSNMLCILQSYDGRYVVLVLPGSHPMSMADITKQNLRILPSDFVHRLTTVLKVVLQETIFKQRSWYAE